MLGVTSINQCEAREAFHGRWRPGGTIRLLEHARSRHRAIGAIQERSAPAWARVSGGCRLDHDVLRAVHDARLTITEQRTRAGGLLVEIVAA